MPNTWEPNAEKTDPHDSCPIKSVYVWQNGMAMVFCVHGKQMPYYQGRYEGEIKRRIEADRGAVEINHGVWR